MNPGISGGQSTASPGRRSRGAPLRVAARFFLVAVAGFALGACTWVEPDANGRSIRVAYDAGSTQRCVDLRRTVTVSVKHSIAGFERDRRKVLDELESLARNQAARIPEADTVRALGPVHDGEQDYAVFDCR